MIYLFYNFLLTFFLLLISPYVLARSLIQRQFRMALSQRMGFFKGLLAQKNVWVHAASVGEVFCSAPMIKRIKKEFPGVNIVLTTMTAMGNETAKTSLPEIDRVLFLPIDHPFFLRIAIEKINPGLFLIAETELWPNLLRFCGKHQIPMILFNGRISQRSFRGYLYLRFLFKECLKYVSLFLMQTEEDRKRIIEIGGEPQKTRVVGNLKFDQRIPPSSTGIADQMAQLLNMDGKKKVLIAGSTHPGEEEILVHLFKKLKEENPPLTLILAPRHLERLEEVERLLRRESFSWQRKTSMVLNPQSSKPEPPEVILLDTMGELMSLYRLASVVFIGGSLVPIGGHNPLEPLFFKKCVLFGPYMFNFLEISRHLIQAGGAISVTGEEDLFLKLKHFLSDDEACRGVGERGYRFLKRHQGATERTMEEIRPFLHQVRR